MDAVAIVSAGSRVSMTLFLLPIVILSLPVAMLMDFFVNATLYSVRERYLVSRVQIGAVVHLGLPLIVN